jgi:hypothetical protein
MVFEQGGPEAEAHIDVCEPPRRLALTTKGKWGVTIEITLAQMGSVTELRFVHHLTDRKLARDIRGALPFDAGTLHRAVMVAPLEEPLERFQCSSTF